MNCPRHPVLIVFGVQQRRLGPVAQKPALYDDNGAFDVEQQIVAVVGFDGACVFVAQNVVETVLQDLGQPLPGIEAAVTRGCNRPKLPFTGLKMAMENGRRRLHNAVDSVILEYRNIPGVDYLYAADYLSEERLY